MSEKTAYFFLRTSVGKEAEVLMREFTITFPYIGSGAVNNQS